MNAARRFVTPGSAAARLGARVARVSAAAAVAALAFASASPARAQDTEPPAMHHYAVRVGAFFPTQGALRNEAGQPYYVFGLEYHPIFQYKPLGGDVYASADIMWRSGGGLGYLTAPILANIVWTLTPSDSQIPVYAGLGGGAYFINTGHISETVQPGLRVIVGANLTEHWFVEGHYDYVGGFTDFVGTSLRVDGLSFHAGYRF